MVLLKLWTLFVGVPWLLSTGNYICHWNLRPLFALSLVETKKCPWICLYIMFGRGTVIISNNWHPSFVNLPRWTFWTLSIVVLYSFYLVDKSSAEWTYLWIKIWRVRVLIPDRLNHCRQLFQCIVEVVFVLFIIVPFSVILITIQEWQFCCYRLFILFAYLLWMYLSSIRKICR